MLCYHAPFVRMSLADQAVAWSSGHTGHRRPDGRWRTACPLTSLLLIARSTTTSLSFVFVVTSIALATSRCCLVVSIDGESCRTVACPANPSSRRLSSPIVQHGHLSVATSSPSGHPTSPILATPCFLRRNDCGACVDCEPLCRPKLFRCPQPRPLAPSPFLVRR